MSASQDLKGIITIGAQCGGPDTGPIGQIKVDLWRALRDECRESFCPAIDEYALVLRIAGSLDDFGPESIERVRRRRPDRYITADIVIPVAVWRPLSLDQSKYYLARRVREAVSTCARRLSADGEAIDASALLSKVDAGIERFLSSNAANAPNNVRAAQLNR
jgi:hypothetical protein